MYATGTTLRGTESTWLRLPGPSHGGLQLSENRATDGWLTILSVLVTWLGTAALIRVAYGAELFAAWPWVRSAGLVTFVTVLLAVVAAYHRARGRAADHEGPSAHELAILSVVAFIPLSLILAYPGAQRLGFWTDGALTGIWGAGVWALQSALFFVIRCLIRL